MKTLKLHQHIPITLINLALQASIEGNMTVQYANELALTAGLAKERTRKTANMLRAITLNNPIISWINENKDDFKHDFLLSANRSAIIASVLCSGFTIFYDAMLILGKYLHTQDEITSSFLKEKLSETYGSNVNFERAMNTLIRMLVECGLLQRIRPGVFAKAKQTEISDFTRKLYRQSYLIHNPYLSDSDNLETNPYFELIN